MHRLQKKEVLRGQQTDYACVTCGAVAWSRAELEREGKKAEKNIKGHN